MHAISTKFSEFDDSIDLIRKKRASESWPLNKIRGDVIRGFAIVYAQDISRILLIGWADLQKSSICPFIVGQVFSFLAPCLHSFRMLRRAKEFSLN